MSDDGDRPKAPDARPQATPRASPDRVGGEATDVASGPAAIPERAVLTILAVDAVASTERIATMDPDDAQIVLDEVFERIRRPIERAGGLLVNFYGDGGLAVFGWPNSQEDHAERACEAAWELQAAGADPRDDAGRGPGAGLRLRVAVHTGLVGLRRIVVGQESRLDLVGGAVHLAAKLEKDAAPDEVLVSSRTVEFCRAALALEPRPEVRTLDRANAAAYRLLARPHRQTSLDLIGRHASPAIGRDATLDRLVAALPRRGAPGRSIAVVGEPGIGKSNLAANILRRARADQSGSAPLVILGDPRRSSTPFAAMHDLLLDARAIDKSVEPDALLDYAEAALQGRAGADRARRRKAPRSSMQAARSLVELLLTAPGPPPRLILIEDAHLLDPETLLCLRLLREDAADERSALVLTCRPEGLSDVAPIADEIVELAPLAEADIWNVARAMSRSARLPPDALASLVRRADGVPFLLQQLLMSSEHAPDLERALPLGIQSLVHARLNRLPPMLKTIAQGLGLLGESVPYEIALSALDVGPETLLRSLRELEALGIVHPFVGRSVRFRHAIVADACLSSMAKDRRRALHASAADAIEATQRTLDDWHATIAAHAVGAGDDDRALRRYWEAGLVARRRSASASLNLIFGEAVACHSRLGPAADELYVDFVLMAFDSVHQLGELEKLERHLQRALDLLQSASRPDKECLGACLLSLIKWFRGDFEAGRALSAEALATAKRLDSLPLVFSAGLSLANALHCLGRIDAAIAQAEALRDLLSGELESRRLGAAGIPGSIARSFIGWYLIEVGRFDEAIAAARDGLRIAEQEDEPYSRVLALMAEGRALLGAGRWAAASERFIEVRAASLSGGYDAIMPNVCGHLGFAYAACGRSEEALAMIADCEARGLHLRTGVFERFVLEAGRAAALFAGGEVALALRSIDRAMDGISGLEAPCLKLLGHDVRARIAEACGRDSAPDRREADRLRATFGLHGWPDLLARRGSEAEVAQDAASRR